MTVEHAIEVLEALSEHLVLGQGLPVISINPLETSWASKCWAPSRLRPALPVGFGELGEMEALSEFNDVYVGISIFGPWVDKYSRTIDTKLMKSPTYGNFMRRAKDNFVAMVAVMVDDVSDMDGTMGPGAKVLASKIGLAPSWKVRTSPNCWQYWYLLQKPITERLIAERFIDDLIAAGLTTDGKDPGMKGVSRVGRLPMGVNSKPKYGTPSPEVYGAEFTGNKFTLTELANGLVIGSVLPDPFREVVVRKFTQTYDSVNDAPKQLQVMQQFLEYLGMVKYNDGRGTMEITCPWLEKHSKKNDKPDDSGSKYFAPSAENGFKGGFYCWHGCCNGRNIRDLAQWAEEKAQRLMTKETV
jgi:RepB DNA-primase from phage plasmid